METKRTAVPAAEEILGGYFPVLDYGFGLTSESETDRTVSIVVGRVKVRCFYTPILQHALQPKRVDMAPAASSLPTVRPQVSVPSRLPPLGSRHL